MPPPALLQEIGSYAGLIALPALVVLGALHFSQARDVRRLREWAGRAPEREAEAARRRAASAAAAPPATASSRPSASAAQSPPVSAPQSPPAAHQSHSEPPTVRAAAPQTPAAQAQPGAVATAPRTQPGGVATAPRPVRPAGERRPPTWAGDEHYGVRPTTLLARLAALRTQRLIPIALAAGAVLVVVLVIVLATSGGSPSRRPAAVPAQRPAAGPASSSVTVAVLNGTGVAGLGHKVGARLTHAGYRLGAVGDAGGRQGTASVVLYATGDAQPAQLVAHSLGVARTAPADAQAQAQAHGAPVVVVVGADMAR